MYQSKKPYLYGTGRRKSSVARVHLFPNGTGSITINGRDIDEYFGLETLKLLVRQPLAATEQLGKVDIVATVTGGGAMYLNQALASHPRLRCTFMHHEQACAMAAEGYARIAGKPAVVMVTTGPGGINALNGVFGAYTDSIPMLVIGGQVKRVESVAGVLADGHQGERHRVPVGGRDLG